MTQTLHGTGLTARARTFEAQAGVRQTEAGELINLLCNEIDSAERFLAHLVSVAIGERCELTAEPSAHRQLGRCASEAVAIRWEDGFADDVCDRHAQLARERGALVIAPQRHNGETRSEAPNRDAGGSNNDRAPHETNVGGTPPLDVPADAISRDMRARTDIGPLRRRPCGPR
ncbi:hypothetical protein B5P44_00515 [Mycobacterium sp. CBMA 213]|uniref:Uncharacterized protein n=1 Tax=Mycolicibacterium sp. CBMA 213 TaxID=1968788 RepID=A0A343VR84_9MYCO|nr:MULTISPECIES: hypothetical protein [unclassified Mycolicibacterium]AVN58408.1 hypothetical protein B5P44_p00113 [Mycolicibacterium sp. CBMA 213]MUL61067.1 hypothetical protein [Mycolicibacterium sp. CBMA 335]MUM03306.1 hypothetical protein [Mycolicibacterium sp. CBMA 213]